MVDSFFLPGDVVDRTPPDRNNEAGFPKQATFCIEFVVNVEWEDAWTLVWVVMT